MNIVCQRGSKKGKEKKGKEASNEDFKNIIGEQGVDTHPESQHLGVGGR